MIQTKSKPKSSKKKTPPKNTHGKIPTASALEYRSTMFPLSKKGTTTTKYCEVEIVEGDGLCARHRDIIDAIMANKEFAVFDGAGQLHVGFDDCKIRKILGSKNVITTNGITQRMGNTAGKWSNLEVQLQKITKTIISVRHVGSRWFAAFPVLTEVGLSKRPTEHGSNKYEAMLKKIVFSVGAVDLLMNDIPLFIDSKIINKMLALKYQVCRSVVRFCLSHTGEQNHDLKDVLSYVGATGNDRLMREYAAQLNEERLALEDLGVFIRGGLAKGTIHYERQKGVFISLGNDQLAAKNETTKNNEKGANKHQKKQKR